MEAYKTIVFVAESSNNIIHTYIIHHYTRLSPCLHSLNPNLFNIPIATLNLNGKLARGSKDRMIGIPAT